MSLFFSCITSESIGLLTNWVGWACSNANTSYLRSAIYLFDSQGVDVAPYHPRWYRGFFQRHLATKAGVGASFPLHLWLELRTRSKEKPWPIPFWFLTKLHFCKQVACKMFYSIPKLWLSNSLFSCHTWTHVCSNIEFKFTRAIIGLDIMSVLVSRKK